MRITAITRFKQAEVYAGLKQIGWSQSELARRTGLSATSIGKILNLQRRPSQREANVIQAAFGEGGVYLDVLSLWPETFRGLVNGFKLEQTADIEQPELLGMGEIRQLPAPTVTAENETVEIIDGLVIGLTDREQAVIEGLMDNDFSIKALADRYGVTASRIRQIEAAAMRKLRNRIKEVRKINWKHEHVWNEYNTCVKCGKKLELMDLLPTYGKFMKGVIYETKK